jgi:hypothetical protein
VLNHVPDMRHTCIAISKQEFSSSNDAMARAINSSLPGDLSWESLSISSGNISFTCHPRQSQPKVVDTQDQAR